MKKMIIIGGGAAGMMTAIHAADGYEVTLLEKNEKLGKKLFITGKGRCNLTNACDEETFLQNVMSNSRFLYSAISSYSPERVMDSFRQWGLSIKTERGNRVFPSSDHSSDVIKTLENEMRRRGVKILLSTEVRDILTEVLPEGGPEADRKGKGKNRPERRVTGVRLAGGKILSADVVVLAAGGPSYPGTGATDFGIRILNDLGLTTRPFQPSLVPMMSDEAICRTMMGLSLKNVELSFYLTSKPKKVLSREFGEMLFTHFGVSGPLVLSASGRLQKYFTPEGKPKEEMKFSIDWKPALSPEQLDARMIKDFESAKNKKVENAMEGLLPSSAILPIINAAGLNPEKKIHDVTKEERLLLRDTLKAFTLPVKGLRGFDEAIISAGGLSVKEVDPGTMEVKRIQGLRVAGELLDCDALTGGFNLQIAWCTAYLAAKSFQ